MMEEGFETDLNSIGGYGGKPGGSEVKKEPADLFDLPDASTDDDDGYDDEASSARLRLDGDDGAGPSGSRVSVGWLAILAVTLCTIAFFFGGGYGIGAAIGGRDGGTAVVASAASAYDGLDAGAGSGEVDSKGSKATPPDAKSAKSCESKSKAAKSKASRGSPPPSPPGPPGPPTCEEECEAKCAEAGLDPSSCGCELVVTNTSEVPKNVTCVDLAFLDERSDPAVEGSETGCEIFASFKTLFDADNSGTPPPPLELSSRYPLGKVIDELVGEGLCQAVQDVGECTNLCPQPGFAFNQRFRSRRQLCEDHFSFIDRTSGTGIGAGGNAYSRCNSGCAQFIRDFCCRPYCASIGTPFGNSNGFGCGAGFCNFTGTSGNGCPIASDCE